MVATRKLGLSPTEAKSRIQSLHQLETVLVDRNLIVDAIDCSAMDQVSFWDGLIICAAARAHCAELWTEDLNHGQYIRGVQIINPFL